MLLTVVIQGLLLLELFNSTTKCLGEKFVGVELSSFWFKLNWTNPDLVPWFRFSVWLVFLWISVFNLIQIFFFKNQTARNHEAKLFSLFILNYHFPTNCPSPSILLLSPDSFRPSSSETNPSSLLPPFLLLLQQLWAEQRSAFPPAPPPPSIVGVKRRDGTGHCHTSDHHHHQVLELAVRHPHSP